MVRKKGEDGGRKMECRMVIAALCKEIIALSELVPDRHDTPVRTSSLHCFQRHK